MQVAAVATMTAKDVINSKKELRQLIYETRLEFKDTAKGNTVSVAERLTKAVDLLPLGDPVRVSITISTDLQGLRACGDYLMKFDLAAMSVDNYEPERAKVENLVLEFDSKWEAFKMSLEEADRLIQERKKEPVKTCFKFCGLCIVGPGIFIEGPVCPGPRIWFAGVSLACPLHWGR